MMGEVLVWDSDRRGNAEMGVDYHVERASSDPT